jgi:cell division protein FtsQ
LLRRAAAAGVTLVLLTLTLAAGYTGGSFGYLWVEEKLIGSPLLTLKGVRISGNKSLSEEQILREAEVHFGDGLMAMNLGQVRSRLLGNPLIRDAAVIRRLPSEIVIEVEERVPTAVVRADRDYIIDREGIVMSHVTGGEGAALPCLSGLWIRGGRVTAEGLQDLQDGIEIVRAIQSAGFPPMREIECVDLSSGSDAVIVPVGGGPLVHLGRERVHERLGRWRLVAGDLASKWEALEYIDLRADGMVVAKPAEAFRDEQAAGGEEG